ncbi:DUF3291 domain-containing protein [Actinomycetes bacterium KLBMP 9797]
MIAYHLAQLNIAHMRAPLGDPLLADFVAALAAVNAAADAAPGFVWRLVDESGEDATGLRPFGPEIMINMSVWESVGALRAYAYQTAGHLEVLRRRREWFDYEGLDNHAVMWWIPAGTLPTLEEARDRLALLDKDGPTPDAFTFRESFPSP